MNTRPASRPRGFTLSEVLVGLAVGGLVLAATLWVVGTHAALQRRQQLALQLDQELRAAAELMTRSLRRAGFWWGAADAASPSSNPYAAWSVAPGPDPQGATVLMAHAHPLRPEDGVRTRDEEQGFRLRGGVLETQLGGGNWQALTDPRLLHITRLELTPRLAPACTSGLLVRGLDITLQAQAVADASVRRQWSSVLRLRNDLAGPDCPANVQPNTPASP
jgi:prepilin-type N-terminal cleavage/methylation domain-containing protein